MKLLYCMRCGDTFSLSKKIRTCTCGESSGVYSGNVDAFYSGFCIPLGFANPSFDYTKWLWVYDGAGKDFTAFTIPKDCKTFTEVKDVKAFVDNGWKEPKVDKVTDVTNKHLRF